MAFLSAYLAQRFGLALIIGAYSAGLAFSRSPLGPALERPLRAVYHALVPIFFVIMGMLVDVGAMVPILGFGSVITLLAIVGKVAGCAAPALLVGFNRLGAIRVGVGMLPRGEVALIIAGAGLTSGAIESDIFGVAVMMTVVTTVLAPVLLIPAFRRGGPGWRAAVATGPDLSSAAGGRHVFTLPAELVPLWSKHLETALATRGFGKVAEIHDPAVDTLIEYRRGEHFLSVQARPERDGRRELVVEADTPEWETVITAAGQEATREAVEGLAESIAIRDTPGRPDKPAGAARRAGDGAAGG